MARLVTRLAFLAPCLILRRYVKKHAEQFKALLPPWPASVAEAKNTHWTNLFPMIAVRFLQDTLTSDQDKQIALCTIADMLREDGPKSALAKTYLAWCYEQGVIVEKKPWSTLWSEAAKNNNRALYFTALHRLNNLDPRFDMYETLEHAAAYLYPPAVFELSKRLTHSDSIAWLELAGAQGFLPALRTLAGLLKDDKRRLELYTKLADDGCPISLSELAQMHEQGLGTSKNIKEAIRLYEAAIEIEKSHVTTSVGACSSALQPGSGVQERRR